MKELNVRMTCKLCGTQGTQELFVKDSTLPSGYRNKCRKCHNSKNHEWRSLNPEKQKECQRISDMRRKAKQNNNIFGIEGLTSIDVAAEQFLNEK